MYTADIESILIEERLQCVGMITDMRCYHN